MTINTFAPCSPPAIFSRQPAMAAQASRNGIHSRRSSNGVTDLSSCFARMANWMVKPPHQPASIFLTSASCGC